jgi:ATP-dependent metalloprotease
MLLHENFELQMNFVCLQESYERAKNILKTHQREHKMLAEALLKYETLDAEDIKAIMAGKEAPERSR